MIFFAFLTIFRQTQESPDAVCWWFVQEMIPSDDHGFLQQPTFDLRRIYIYINIIYVNIFISPLRLLKLDTPTYVTSYIVWINFSHWFLLVSSKCALIQSWFLLVEFSCFLLNTNVCLLYRAMVCKLNLPFRWSKPDFCWLNLPYCRSHPHVCWYCDPFSWLNTRVSWWNPRVSCWKIHVFLG